jgi:hypothetical protein
MANNALAIFDPAQLPSHIAEVMKSGESNIVTRPGFNSVTFAGKVWAITLNGDKRPLMKRNEEGEEEPVQTFNAIILAYPERRGRTYYEGAYNAEQESAPVCWSNDGITPDEKSPKRQSATCAKCPMSAKGSRQTENGKAARACGEHRMVAVIPASRIGEFPPMRMKLAITSDYDGQNKTLQAQGWFAFSNYMDFLKGKRVNFTYLLTTKIKFDPTEGINYPKLIFSPGKWLSSEQFEAVKQIATSPEIEGILKTEFNPKIEDAPLTEEEDELAEQPVVTAKPAGRTVAKPAAKPAPEPEDDGEGGEEPEPAPVKPAPNKPAPAAAKANGHAPVVADEDDEPVVTAKPAPAKPAANPKAEAAVKAAAARKAAPQVADEGEEAPPAPVKPKAGGKPAASTPPVAASAAVNSVLSDWDD